MKLALFGYGGHAREVAAQMGKEVNVTFFVDDNYAKGISKPISEFNPKKYLMMVAVADSKDRKEIVSKLPKETEYFTFIHPTAQIMSDDVIIGEGSFIGANCILTSNIRIGDHAILNRGNHIGHDCNIASFFSLMPGAIISGNVNVGDSVYIGTNSSVREKINICDDVVIGLNTGIIKNITSSGTYAGNPIKKIS
jgi:sugar O-acyltransferase (sialic acid O-acetyltransferase NeuD family)